ncbi:hypothetical protein K491DRAFT_683066 [Lophiostoma macrostomum CBS 122681]|uniref:Uncharacterized protein n=1 Tax=Lophiostoma macrostomum CBS 122681 TaxID=1314788 RepID=A0A6A6SUS6_9PLEO|nr:hypothetical protein K491DRAFT_683066 [Lophiostoma macrostomum CBS 122681]
MAETPHRAVMRGRILIWIRRTGAICGERNRVLPSPRSPRTGPCGEKDSETGARHGATNPTSGCCQTDDWWVSAGAATRFAQRHSEVTSAFGSCRYREDTACLQLLLYQVRSHGGHPFRSKLTESASFWGVSSFLLPVSPYVRQLRYRFRQMDQYEMLTLHATTTTNRPMFEDLIGAEAPLLLTTAQATFEAHAYGRIPHKVWNSNQGHISRSRSCNHRGDLRKAHI